MGETANNIQDQKPIAFDSTTVSLGLGFGGFLVGSFMFGPAGGAFGIVGLAFGLVGLYQRKKRGRKSLRDISATGGVVINLFLIVAGAFSLHSERNIHFIAHRVVCGANLNTLGNAIKAYSSDNDGKYPAPDSWCDLLVEHTDVDERLFVCRSVEQGRCHYAINPNCKPNSPVDIVLLFETKSGWNQFGGPEILTLENHKDIREGCNILFNDGHVEFVTIERLSKLKWKDKE
jgi:prepilin-type processing-associated H-X9-DG protein